MARRLRVSLTAGLLLWSAMTGVSHSQTRWVGSWAASQQLVEPHNSLPADSLRDATLRQIVRLSIGGPQLRVHVSNRFGSAPLHFTSVHLAKAVAPGSSKIVEGTDHALTFSGRPDVTIPAGADYVSDPVAFAAAALSNVAITLHIERSPTEQTGHPGSRTTSYLVHGNRVSAAEFSDAEKADHWYFVAGIDVSASSDATAIVVLGDSITDGHGATTNGNNRWPDILAERLQRNAGTHSVAVLNHGIGGNRLLQNSLGPNALSRFDHDVLAQAGARFLIVLEGINDLGMLTRNNEVTPAEHEELVRGILAAYDQFILRAHANGLKVIGATILPFGGSQFYHPGPNNEADRQAINQWIRTPGHFDAVIDFDRVTRDPEHPDRMLPAFDSGDHLHPSAAGYAAMAEAVPLSLFGFSSGATLHVPRMAITFDDLPAHGSLPPGEDRVQIASRILTALKEAHIPSVYGFVNGQRLEQQPADAAVLQAWRAAGFPLANHTWSHMNLNQNEAAAFDADIEKNEPMLRSWMKKGDWHWFRFPFLKEGDSPQKTAAIREFLAGRGYKIAAVTMSFNDYEWNEPYARCKAKGDNQAILALESSYLAAAEESIAYYRGLSHTLFDRDIAYVLLMHIGAFDAEMLPRLLRLYASHGFKFVTLADAERDEFYLGYSIPRDLTAPGTLERAMETRHLPLPPRATFASQLETLCR